MKVIYLLIISFSFLIKDPIEVSIWTNIENENFQVFNKGKKVKLLDTSTSINRRFYVKDDELELMLVSGKDTCYMDVILTKEKPTLVACF